MPRRKCRLMDDLKSVSDLPSCDNLNMLVLHRQSSVLVGPIHQVRHSTGEAHDAAASHALSMHILRHCSRFVNTPNVDVDRLAKSALSAVSPVR
jgi:hypothetical protein